MQRRATTVLFHMSRMRKYSTSVAHAQSNCKNVANQTAGRVADEIARICMEKRFRRCHGPGSEAEFCLQVVSRDDPLLRKEARTEQERGRRNRVSGRAPLAVQARWSGVLRILGPLRSGTVVGKRRSADFISRRNSRDEVVDISF